jgi:UDP-galactopyranose mutase
MYFDYVIVGAGFSGCVVAEQIASQLIENESKNVRKNKKIAQKRILIIEKRNHIGGNCFDFRDENGILIHKYGPHIFHTNNEKVWNYLSQFSDFEKYEHRVLGNIDGNLVPIPFNLNSIYKCFPKKFAENLETKLLEKYELGTKIPILNLRNEDDNDLKFLADFIYKKVFLNYTIKQWNLTPEQLDESVTSRIPFFISRDDRYFQDKYQGIPKKGYTELLQKMIEKPNIHVLLNTDFFAIKKELKYEKLIFTGMIDEFFDFEFGKLPYRSLNFEFETLDFNQKSCNKFQPVAQVNYPNEFDFTRITEFSHFFANQNFSKTVIAKEFPISYNHNSCETPYYPIPQKKNAELFQKFRKKAAELKKTIFLGRLADYSYYNMDQAILRALEISEKNFN